jgi:hypothetical protein
MNAFIKHKIKILKEITEGNGELVGERWPVLNRGESVNDGGAEQGDGVRVGNLVQFWWRANHFVHWPTIEGPGEGWSDEVLHENSQLFVPTCHKVEKVFVFFF